MDMKVVLKTSHEIMTLIAELDEFKGRWSAAQALAPERMNALKQVATIESIGSSTRIEGVKLTDVEIEKLLRGTKAFSFRSRDEQEVAGYAEAMELVFANSSELLLKENHVKQLHATLLKFSTKDERHRGEYKKFPNSIEAFSKGKSIGVVFETETPLNTPRRMTELLDWTNKAFEEKQYHPLLVVAVFVVHFLEIHPFQDGNGRLSRILTTLLLLQRGYTYVPYSSMERVIETNKEQYYLALRRVQGTFKKKAADYTDWVLFFLQSLLSQKKNLEKKIDVEQAIMKLPELSLQILALIKDHGRVTVRDVVAVTKQNRNTIKLHLKQLVKAGHLSQQGQGKGTWYRISP